MKRIILLGASGSIGKQSIDIIKHQESLQLVGVSVGENVAYLEEILTNFDIKYACLKRRNDRFIEKYPTVKFFFGDEGLKEIVKVSDYDLLINALVGITGFIPSLKAIANGKDIALANKETLVIGGELINQEIRKKQTKIYPIDSEHSAIFQCLQGSRMQDVSKLYITASGGSFRDKSHEECFNLKKDEALKHPNWQMGKKITIDSTTMMNKAFEIIEAHYLFDIEYENIEPVLHRQSIVHSLIEFKDCSILSQLGSADMHLAIRYALLHPCHIQDECVSKYDLFSNDLSFSKMDYNRYPLVSLAYEVGKKKGNAGAILVGANDTAVELYLQDKITYLDLESFILKVFSESKFEVLIDEEILLNSYHQAKAKILELYKEKYG